MNSFQNASHSGIIGIALFLLLLRMLMFFCLFVLRTKPMSEDICHVIIDDSRGLMSPEPNIVDLKGYSGPNTGGLTEPP